MIYTPKKKKIDFKKSTGYVSFIVKGNDSINRLEISSFTDDSPLLDFILNNEPDNTFKEVDHDIYIKLLEKNINIVYLDPSKNILVETNDVNCPNLTGVLSTNRLNHIYYYYPEQKYTYGTISNELLLFAKKYITEPSEYLQNLFNKFVSVFNKYVIKLLNSSNEIYVLCCVPSHEASDINNNTMARVIAEIKKKYFITFFIDGTNVITRKTTVVKSSSNEEKRTIEKQLNSIEIKEPEKVKNKTVLLIDDFYTSGVTMDACKKILLDNGAKQVILFAFAKTRDYRRHNE